MSEPPQDSTPNDKETGVADVNSSSSSDEHQIIRRELPRFRFWMLSIGLGLGLFLSFLDSSIVATSLFEIGTEFGDIEKVNWVALAYTLAYLGCATLFARISDIIGRRNAFLAAFVIFFGISIGCGFAQNMNQLIALRAVQGLGGSGLYSITMIIWPEIASPKMMQFIASMVAVVMTMSSVLGPLLGGILTNYTTWRWVFWINGPIGFVSMVLFYLAWPKAEYLPDIERRTWAELDYPGSFLLIAASVLVVFAFQNGSSTTDGWSKPTFLAPLIVGIALWILLIVWVFYSDRRWGDKIASAFPMNLLRNRVYTFAVFNTLFLGFPYIMIVYAFPLRLQVVNGKNPLDAGLYLLPMLGSSAVGSVLTGAVNSKNDRLFETLLASSILMTIGCGLLTTLSSSPNLEPKALGFLVFMGLGFGLSGAASTMVAKTQSSLRDISPAQGVLAQLRILGGSIGIAASSAILGVKFLTELAGQVDPSKITELESHNALTPSQLDAVRQAYADAFTEDLQVCTAVAGVAILLALGIYQRDRPTVEERTKQQIDEEVSRRRAVQRAKMAASS